MRFTGPTLGRRTTFWPARHAAVMEAMRQMSWPFEELMVAADEPALVPATPVRADRSIAYRSGPASWILLALAIGIAVAVVLSGPPVVFTLFAVSIWGWAAATTVYRVECDGLVLRCHAPILHRTIPVPEVLTVHGGVGGLVASGGKTTITPRRGPRMWLLVISRTDRTNLASFLDQLEQIAPSTTIRR